MNDKTKIVAIVLGGLMIGVLAAFGGWYFNRVQAPEAPTEVSTRGVSDVQIAEGQQHPPFWLTVNVIKPTMAKVFTWLTDNVIKPIMVIVFTWVHSLILLYFFVGPFVVLYVIYRLIAFVIAAAVREGNRQRR